MRFPWIAGLLFAVAAGAQESGRDLALAQPARRALLIGNDMYQNVRPLNNGSNDANDLAVRLKELDFSVTVVTDADLRTMEQAIDRFIAGIEPGDVALFHFAGHGVQLEQENYLIPTDFVLKDAASVRYDAYSASKLHDRLGGSGASLKIILLDACRNNGFQSSRGATGLAAMNPAHGSFIAFATGPGRAADDNPRGRNGLFTGVLIDALAQPGVELVDVFREVRRKVSETSGGRQVPWTISSVLGRFYFNGRPIQPEADTAVSPIAVETPSEPAPDIASGEIRTNPEDGTEYVWIPPGEFKRGCVEGDGSCDTDERPAGKVRITRGFWMARTETTVAAYAKAADQSGQPMPPEPGKLKLLLTVAKGFNPGWRHRDQPIVNVSWASADWYCREVAGGRLPTEAEWERAARGGDEGGIYPWGPTPSHENANYGSALCCFGEKKGRDQWLGAGPVASFEPNGYGLYDMHGNVSEWTSDWFSATYYAAPPDADPQGPQQGTLKPTRGGAWSSPPAAIRTSDRYPWAPDAPAHWLGFRCVADDLP